MKLFSFFVLFVVFFFGMKAMGDPVQEEAVLKVVEQIDAFAAKNDISQDAALVLFNDVLYRQELLQKGGFGIVKKGALVDLHGTVNRIVFGKGKADWEGFSRDKRQIVIIAGEGVLGGGELKGRDINSIIICIFLPDKVQIYDLAAGKGGFYLRQEE